MQVILTQNVSKLGQAHDLVQVKRGYATNYLLPQKKAIFVTPSALSRSEKVRAGRIKKMEEVMANAQAIADQLKGITLTFKEKVQGEKLYGSITAKDVVAELATAHKIEISKDLVKIKHPIKTLGGHKVVIHLTEDINAELKVVVEAGE